MACRPWIQRLHRAAARLACAFGVAALLISPRPAAASEPVIAGADAPALIAALDLWLDDAEDRALPEIATLAGDGNKAARLLLAVIDKTPSLQGPWLAYLSRSERIALLRQPGGLSGRSWFHALGNHPLGAAWQAIMLPDAGPEVVDTFVEFGEQRAAREALVVLTAREHPALDTIPLESVDPELLYLLWRGTNDDRRAALFDRVARDSPQRVLMGGRPEDARLLDWLSQSEAGAPLVAVCAFHCTATRERCLGGAYAALASHNALLVLGSPVEALIPQDEFLASPRGRASVLRRILQTHDARGRRALIAQMRNHDACLADVLEAEAARYRYRRPGSTAGPGD